MSKSKNRNEKILSLKFISEKIASSCTKIVTLSKIMRVRRKEVIKKLCHTFKFMEGGNQEISFSGITG